MPSRKSYSCGGVIIGRPSDGRRKPQEQEREGEKGEKTREKGEREMNLLGGLGGDRSEKKHGNVCAMEVVFVGATKTGLIFCSSRFVATWLYDATVVAAAAAATNGVACFT